MLSNKNRMLLQSVKTFIAREATHKLDKVIEKTHPADLGLIFRHLRVSEAKMVLEHIPDIGDRAEVLVETETELAAEILRSMPPKEISRILQEMFSDDAAQILERFDENLRDVIIQEMADAESKDLEERFGYAEETAGRIMVPDFLAFPPDTTTADAIAGLQASEDFEIVYYLYVISEDGQLVGVVSLRQLLLVEPTTPLRDIMVTDVITARTDDDREEVARKVSRYNLLAIPVVDEIGRMLGIITVDDILEIIKDEATEDMLMMAGTTVSDDSVVRGSVWGSVKIRWPWLLASWFGGLFAFFVTDQFEDALTRVVLLAGFIPIVLGMGGNVGTQSSIIVVRGLALRSLDGNNVLAVTTREICVGGVLGLIYGSLLAAAVFSIQMAGFGGTAAVAHLLPLVVGMGVFSSMLVASIIGASIPLLLDRLGVDPAIATGPLVTTSVDVLGVLVYFTIATLLLGL